MEDSRLSENVNRKYTRLVTLLESPAVNIAATQTEIADIKADLMANGQSEAEIEAHVGPDRYNPKPVEPVEAESVEQVDPVE